MITERLRRRRRAFSKLKAFRTRTGTHRFKISHFTKLRVGLFFLLTSRSKKHKVEVVYEIYLNGVFLALAFFLSYTAPL